MSFRDYRLYELNDSEFEELCSRIAIELLGSGFINFSIGPDGGKDGVFEGTARNFPNDTSPYSGKFIIQAKHTVLKDASCSESAFLKTILNKEIKKIIKLVDDGQCEHYILLTNRKLTGNCESKIKTKIKLDVPNLTSFSIWGVDRIHTHIKQHRQLQKDFCFNLERTPLTVKPDELETVISTFRAYINQTSSNNKKKKKDFQYLNISKKNKLNGLSNQYHEYITSDAERYFAKIKTFLEDPKHANLAEVYENTAYDFKGTLITNRSKFDSLDEILEEFYNRSYDYFNDKAVIFNKRLLKTFIFFMYFNCDIGEKVK